MNLMQQSLPVTVPAPLRAIFAEWAETCDPGPLCQGGADPHACAQLYRLLADAAAAAVGLTLAREALARIYADALVNMAFGQFAELRREGAQVFPWIAQVVASDPVLRGRLD